nr:MAG TPA: hypothetical protein [Caudoviricetes sp.]
MAASQFYFPPSIQRMKEIVRNYSTYSTDA